MSKFAILSNSIPPEISGQAIVLGRILEDIPSSSYILLSSQQKNFIRTKTNRIVYTIKEKTLPVIGAPIVKNFLITINFILSTFNKSLQIVNIIKQNNIKILIACSGDLTDLPSAYIASKINGTGFIIYLFDDYVFQWLGYQRKLASYTCKLIIKKTNIVIAANEFLAKEYSERYGIKVMVVRNPYMRKYETKPQNFKKTSTTKKIVYTGSVYHAHYDAFRRLLLALQAQEIQNYELHIFTSQSKKELKKQGIYGKKLKIHKAMTDKEVVRTQRQADILFLPLAFKSEINEVINTSSPGKMSEYLISGKPILVHAPKKSYLSWFFRKNQCGYVVDDPDVNALIRAINEITSNRKLSKMLVENAEKISCRFSPTVVANKFTNVINRYE